MVRHCAVTGCNSDTRYQPKGRPKIRFFKFPGCIRKPALRKQWILNVNRQGKDGQLWDPSRESVVCEKHFVDGRLGSTTAHPVPQIDMGHKYVTKVRGRRPLNKQASPACHKRTKSTIQPTPKDNENLPENATANTDPLTDKTPGDMAEDQTLEILTAPPGSNSAIETTNLEIGSTDNLSADNHLQPQTPPAKSTGEDTDNFCTEVIHQQRLCNFFHSYAKTPPILSTEKVKQLENELDKTKAELRAAKAEVRDVRQQFSYKNIKWDDAKTRQFTGFPTYRCFYTIFERLLKKKAGLLTTRHREGKGAWHNGPFTSKPGPERHLALIDEFLLVMMRLRLALLHNDLAERFQVSQSVVSRILRLWLPFLSKRLKRLIKNPSKEQIRAHLPKSFSKYRDTRIIIDCTEIFVERPTTLLARQQTWSTYKHHNTAKILIGVTPEGGISYLSKAWGGRTSDKHIVNNSGFLKQLEPYDEVMADRGFTIAAELAQLSCRLNMPAFTGGKSQLGRSEVHKNRKCSSKRIHVERAIEKLKNFRILQGVYQMRSLDLLDDILTVCAAVVNMWQPIVRK